MCGAEKWRQIFMVDGSQVGSAWNEEEKLRTLRCDAPGGLRGCSARPRRPLRGTADQHYCSPVRTGVSALPERKGAGVLRCVCLQHRLAIAPAARSQATRSRGAAKRVAPTSPAAGFFCNPDTRFTNGGGHGDAGLAAAGPCRCGRSGRRRTLSGRAQLCAPEFDTKSPFEAISGVGLVMNQ